MCWRYLKPTPAPSIEMKQYIKIKIDLLADSRQAHTRHSQHNLRNILLNRNEVLEIGCSLLTMGAEINR